MKTKTEKPEKEKRWKLKGISCLQLSDLITSPLGEKKPNPTNGALRRRYDYPDQLKKLRLCGGLSAVHHASHVRTAARLLAVPTLVLTATGGKPKASSMPRYDAALRRMAEVNGLPVVHRFGKGAFFLSRNPPKSDPVVAGLCDKPFNLAKP